MKIKRISALFLLLALTFSVGAGSVLSTEAVITTPVTGYTCAADVVYKTYNEGGKTVIANWGARGEVATFLSTKAEAFYGTAYTYDLLSEKAGGTGKTDAPQSELYSALKSLMTAKHSYIISYQDTRPLYRYTDCVSGDKTNFSSFYSGTLYDGTWVGGNNTPWNREHVWPNSKCIGSKVNDGADIMMLRPTITNENSSRGNTAYGEGIDYFEPADDVKGDCARVVLYGYTRWGNTGKMWGTGGVIESPEILLKWMIEDPVDTWEMGRNDAVESIIGTRNVFVDYPEYAFLLLGAEIPADLTTPSGEAKSTDTPEGGSGSEENTGNIPNNGAENTPNTPAPAEPTSPISTKTVIVAVAVVALIGTAVVVTVILIKRRRTH